MSENKGTHKPYMGYVEDKSNFEGNMCRLDDNIELDHKELSCECTRYSFTIAQDQIRTWYWGLKLHKGNVFLVQLHG
jgi:hypothetical protein